MSNLGKKNSKTQSKAASSEQDEIDQIMSEIEELRTDLEATVPPDAPAKPSHSTAVKAPLSLVAETADDAEVQGDSDSQMEENLEVQSEEAEEKAQESDETQIEHPAAAEEDILAEFQQGGSADASMEETLGDLREEASSKPSLLDGAITPTDEQPSLSLQQTQIVADEDHGQMNHEQGVPMENEMPTGRKISGSSEELEEIGNAQQNPGQPENGTLTLSLSGNMTLKLKYEMDGNEVSISFAQSTLKVTLENGTEFKIPVGASKTKRKNLKRVA